MTDAIAALAPRVSLSQPLGAVTPAVPGAAAPSEGFDPSSGPTFGEVLEQVSRDAVGSLRTAEATSISAVQGQASTLEVVEAIKSAEHALQTATAVRDKIVQAYQEISRMAI